MAQSSGRFSLAAFASLRLGENRRLNEKAHFSQRRKGAAIYFSKTISLSHSELSRYRLFDKLPRDQYLERWRAHGHQSVIIGAAPATARGTDLMARVNRMEPQGLGSQPLTRNFKSSSGRSSPRRGRAAVVSSVALAAIALLALFWLFRSRPPKPFAAVMTVGGPGRKIA